MTSNVILTYILIKQLLNLFMLIRKTTNIRSNFITIIIGFYGKKKKRILITNLNTKKTKSYYTGTNKYQYYVLKNLKLYLAKKKFSLCTINDCVKTLKIIKKIIDNEKVQDFQIHR